MHLKHYSEMETVGFARGQRCPWSHMWRASVPCHGPCDPNNLAFIEGFNRETNTGRIFPFFKIQN